MTACCIDDHSPSRGWVCPKCGRAHAPHVSHCDCPWNWRPWHQPTSQWRYSFPPYQSPNTICCN